MKRSSSDLPPLRIHKATGQGYILLNGKRRYLGRYGGAACRERYDRLVAEWLARGRRPEVEPTDLTVVELCAKFGKFLTEYYVTPDGAAGKEQELFCIALKPVKEVYGSTKAVDFGPKRLKAVRERMIGKGWTRNYINKHIIRVRRMFKWAASEELLPASIHEALRTVPGLKLGRCQAPESEPVRPVPMEHVTAIKPYVSKPVWAAVELQLLTGARPGEVLAMRPVDLNTEGSVWEYSPVTHKTAHRGHRRAIFIGPKGQEIIKPFVAGRAVDAYLFDPRDAVNDMREKRHSERTTPLSCGNRPGTKRKEDPQRQAGARYNVGGYRIAIRRACKKANIPGWHPHQLRHTAGTLLRREFGIETARAVLGHARLDATEIYSEMDMIKARVTMQRIG